MHFSKTNGMAIIHKGGVFKQVDVYVCREELFVNTMGGYVRIYTDGATSVPQLSVKALELTGTAVCNGATGRLRTAPDTDVPSAYRRQWSVAAWNALIAGEAAGTAIDGAAWRPAQIEGRKT